MLSESKADETLFSLKILFSVARTPIRIGRKDISLILRKQSFAIGELPVIPSAGT
jgi:hypothetical protein